MNTTNSNSDIKAQLDTVVDLVLSDYRKNRDIDKMDVFTQPQKDAVIDILEKLLGIIFPGYYRDKNFKIYNYTYRLSMLVEDVFYNLSKQTSIALRYRKANAELSQSELDTMAHDVVFDFFNCIPKIREYVSSDLEATFDGDPAADSYEDIILSYPGLLASTVNRIAHEMFLLDIPLIPRMMTEYAHSITGIDIHPGATIGKYLMMDHGTGIVVGSSSVIGEHVKIYQGVTIGALSTKGGQSMHGTKRHPTIEDNVTIYAGASILGGNTLIGHDAVIGSNAFITESVPAGAKISMTNR